MTERLRQQIAQHKHDLEEAQRSGDRRAEARALAHLGGDHAERGEFEMALGHLQGALALARQFDEAEAAGWALSYLGLIHARQGHIHKAVRCYLEALDTADHALDLRTQLVALDHLIGTYRDLHEPDKALICSEHKLKVAETASDRALIAQAAAETGRAALDAGDQRRAVSALARAVVAARKNGLRESEREALIQLGMLHQRNGAPRKAAAVYRQALSGYDPERDRAVEASLLAALAAAYQESGELAEAIKYMRRAVIHYAEIGNVEMQGRSLLALGEIQRLHGETADARSSVEAARAAFVRLGLADGVSQCDEALAGLNGVALREKTSHV